MGCQKSTLKYVYTSKLEDSILINIEDHEYDHVTYCMKCDMVGIKNKVLHCDICDRCHHISKYINCSTCNLCLNPLCENDIIKHRKNHKNLV